VSIGVSFFTSASTSAIGHPQPDRALGQHLADRQLVQVQRVVVVDGAPQQVGQVVDVGPVVAAGPGEAGQLLLDPAGELGLQTALGHDMSGDADEIGTLVLALGMHASTIAVRNGPGPT
jgi:hypothetical protein